MSVQLVEGRFRVDCPPNSFSPAAAEIYSAVFEEESAVRGVAVTAREFRSTGIQFSEEVAEPLLVLELEVG
ncbi:MAG TPA: hypothetical protein VK993_14025, partial [Chthoniobacterales bacterium]|nr:hypothetical protein [Chthoniobacterales bacterium]